ncbi:MAG: RNA-binding S4 domain-containing protein [Saprospiraceae bacterium]|nr:RNA-binding S4 domain-containing protein [Saprospiraceae bacterium]
METQKRKKIRPGDHVEFNEIRITVYRIINSSVF